MRLLAAILCLIPALALAEPPEDGMGLNLARHSYYSSNIVFVDALKRANRWATWGADFEFETTDEGWPKLDNGEIVYSLLYRNIGDHYPEGVYTCTWEGEGKIDFRYAGEVIERGDHLLKVKVNPGNNGVMLRIKESDKDDPVRNIRLWLPGFSPEEQGGEPPTFHPRFIESLEGFRVLRFMDWQRTNHSEIESWRDRTRLDRFSYSGQDMPLELMIELCNETGADPWFCMPHKADAGFVRRFARMVRDRLHPEATVYVEYSNELWNTNFEQTRWIREQAGSWGGPHVRERANQAYADFAIWRGVFGDEADRIVRVASGQAANVWQAEQLTEHLGGAFDAIAIAPYFNGGGEDVRTILDNAERNIDGKVVEYIREHRELAERRGVPLIAYEAGQHIKGRGEAGIEVQRHPGMERLYYRYMLRWESEGGGLMMQFAGPADWPHRRHGAWGVMEHMDDTDSPKWQALMRWMGRGE